MRRTLVLFLMVLPVDVGAQQAPGSSFRDCDVCPEMVVIPAGSFLMGSPDSEPFRQSQEDPQHKVTIAKPFAVGRYEVTFDEWDACVAAGGCKRKPKDEWGRGRMPVINVTWNDARQYTNWLSRKTGKRYRLPTEAEWEYVARAGTTTAYSTGSSINPSQAKYNPTGCNPRGSCKPVPVGSHAPNAFGLFDVHGNVAEWVEDCMDVMESFPNYRRTPTDGTAWTGDSGPNSGSCGDRILRGGDWGSSREEIRSAVRRSTLGGIDTFRSSNWIGFRVAR